MVKLTLFLSESEPENTAVCFVLKKLFWRLSGMYVVHVLGHDTEYIFLKD